MTQKAQPRVNFPLWVIAISLLIIAACMVLDFYREKGAQTTDDAAVEPAPAEEPSPATPKPKPVTKTFRPAARPQSEPEIGEPSQKAEAPMPSWAVETSSDQDNPREFRTSTSRNAEPVGGYAPSVGLTPNHNLGTIVGRVRLRGTPAPETEIASSKSRVCTDMFGQPLKTRFFVVSPDDELADTVVFIKSGFTSSKFSDPTNGTGLLLSLTNCQMDPYVSAVPIGRLVVFRSNDGLPHSLEWKPARDRSIRIDLANGDSSSRPAGFREPELFVPVTCSTHPWEFAYVCVFDHPFFDVTRLDGRFIIPNVPPGEYVMEAAHKKATGADEVTERVTVIAGQQTVVDLTIDLASRLP